MTHEIICSIHPCSPSCRQAIKIGKDQEGFLALRDGGILTVLPGETSTCKGGEKGLAVFCRGVSWSGLAGAGGILYGQENTIGGWCSFQCHLLSPRRFMVRHQDDLLRGEAADEILVSCMRQILSDVFSKTGEQAGRQTEPDAVSHRRIWSQARQMAQQQLLDSGWQLDEFRPQRLQIKRVQRWTGT